jgi:hypothetical protein
MNDSQSGADPFGWFEQLRIGHQQFATLMSSTLGAAPLDERSKAQWGFALRQVTDAMNPANALASNPEALQLAMQSGGASLVEGARLFLDGLAKGRISMSDGTAFEVGRNLATPPGSVVFENELMQLIQYAPTTAKVHKRPLVIVPPCINKFYIQTAYTSTCLRGLTAYSVPPVPPTRRTIRARRQRCAATPTRRSRRQALSR